MPSRVATHRPAGTPTEAEVRRSYDGSPDRRADKRFYDSAAWRRLRAAILAEWPLCRRCPEGRPTPAVEVHHREPRHARPDLALDPDNLEGLCRTCHRKARPEDRAHRSA